MRSSIIRRPLAYRYYNAALALIAVNLFIFLITAIVPKAKVYLSLIPGLVIQEHAYWQFLTYMFTHADISHILFNMLGLFFFGVQVERRMGSSEFLLFYLICGIGAGLFSFLIYWLSGSYLVILLGASGAVYAVLLAFAVFYPYANIYVMGLIPVRAPLLVLIYTAIELFSQFFSLRSGIAHLTHLAGFGFAFLYFLIRLGINPITVFRRNGKNPFH
jgi:membrane associated rhomboid family serine protease